MVLQHELFEIADIDRSLPVRTSTVQSSRHHRSPPLSRRKTTSSTGFPSRRSSTSVSSPSSSPITTKAARYTFVYLFNSHCPIIRTKLSVYLCAFNQIPPSTHPKFSLFLKFFCSAQDAFFKLYPQFLTEVSSCISQFLILPMKSQLSQDLFNILPNVVVSFRSSCTHLPSDH